MGEDNWAAKPAEEKEVKVAILQLSHGRKMIQRQAILADLGTRLLSFANL
jgi:hypothetical protein